MLDNERTVARGARASRPRGAWSPYTLTPSEQAALRRAEPAPAPELARFHKPALDILRFGAFAMVFVHHWLPGRDGWIQAGFPGWAATLSAGLVSGFGRGVDLFFALSSYLITELLLREVERFGTLDVRAFWVRRALRIWPLYFAFLGFCALVMPAWQGEVFPLVHVIAFALFGGNWSVAALGYPASSASLLWSVSIEEQFYLGWPLLLRQVGTRHLVPVCVGLIVAAVATRVVLAAVHAPHPAVWTNAFARMDLFAGGALLAVYLRRSAPRLRLGSRVGLVVVATTVFVVLGVTDAYAGWRGVPGYSLAVAASVAIILAVQDLPVSSSSRVARTLSYLGRISFGLYVFHMLALKAATHWSASGFLVRSLIAAVLTVSLAAASYRWLETPFLRLKHRFARVPSGAA